MVDYNKINLDHTINSGQVFLWKRYQSFWFGVNGKDVLRIDDSGKIRSCTNTKTDFLRKKDNMEKIIQSISKDKIIKSSIEKYNGLRILRQDPFQCFISFIISSNSNIQKIRSNLEKLSTVLGEKVEFEKKEFYLFPDAKAIADSTIEKIKDCGLGYRAKFVLNAARMVEDGRIDFDDLKKISYNEAKKIILQVPGIGNKVADCVLLFSLEKFEAFPLDRWMIRILQKYYNQKFDLKTKTITEKQYQILHDRIIEYFGPYAGFAQQFLFKMERENYQKKWL